MQFIGIYTILYDLKGLSLSACLTDFLCGSVNFNKREGNFVGKLNFGLFLVHKFKFSIDIFRRVKIFGGKLSSCVDLLNFLHFKRILSTKILSASKFDKSKFQ